MQTWSHHRKRLFSARKIAILRFGDVFLHFKWMIPLSDDAQNQKSSGGSKVQQLGDFELKKKLGKGGMGEVFLARQISLDRMVALKTLTKELAKKPDFVARFEREAKSMAKIDHPKPSLVGVDFS